MKSNITLAILVYNHARFLKELLDSILKQDDQEFNVVILDNNSSDGSDLILQQWTQIPIVKGRVQLRINPINTGSALGLKTIVNMTTTKYLCVIHGDDVLKPNYTKIVKSFITNQNSPEALNVNLLGFSENGGQKNLKRIYRPLWTRFSGLNALLISGLNAGLMPGSVLKKEFIEANNLLEFPELINGVEDWLLWMRIIRANGRISRINNTIYEYRIHPGQFSAKDEDNAYYYGFARRMVIEESRSFLERCLARAEVSYELKRFRNSTNYIKGLGISVKESSHKYRYLRFVNIVIRRIAVAIQLL